MGEKPLLSGENFSLIFSLTGFKDSRIQGFKDSRISDQDSFTRSLDP